MGFTSAEALKLTFKVQAGNVIDAASGSQWYESIFPYNPAFTADRILSEFDTVRQYPAANLATAQSNVSSNLVGIVEDLSAVASAVRLTRAVPGGDNTWVSYNTYNDASSGVKDLWLQPQRIPQANGLPSAGYGVALYSGDPNAGGVLISTTLGQSGGEVGWVFNYDMGLLFLANDLVSTISGDAVTYPAGLDFYINGFRYIGETLADFSSGTGGTGGRIYLPGDGINIIPGGTADTIEVGIYASGPSGPNLQITDGKLDFKGVHVEDESIPIGSYSIFNFIGDDVLSEDSNLPGKVNVYIPTPTFASHWNTTDGETTGTVAESNISRSNVRISTPTSEASPYFKTGGWAGSTQSATTQPNPYFGPSQTGTGLITGLSATGGGGTQDSTMEVNVYDADGVSLLATYTTPALNGNATHGSTGANAGITVLVSNYQTDVSKFKANLQVQVDMDTIFTTNSLDGGRYNVEAIHTTDSGTDGGGTYTYTQSDIFYDTNNSTPSISGSMTLVESTTPANILTKHLSGVEYYILSSQFEVGVTGIDDLNENTQGRSNTDGYNFRITAAEYGLPTRNLEAWSLSHGTWNGTWTNNWDLQGADYEYTSWPITNSNYRYRGPSANGSSVSYDPWGTSNTVNSANDSILVDTFTDNSTKLGEDFDGEDERLVRGATGYTAWDSTTSLGTGTTGTGLSGPFCDACVVGSNLVRPDQFFLTDPNTSTIQANLSTYSPDKNGANPNYSGASYQDTAVYHRRFYTTGGNLGRAISSFTVTFSGNAGTSANFTEALEDTKLKFYVRRIAQPSGQTTASVGFNANPLALHGALYNSGAPGSPFDDGASGVDTVGSLIRTSNAGGNVVPATFGGLNAEEGFWAEIQIIDSSIRIDYINVTLTFSGGTPATDSDPVS